jgi:hypothetical protein
MGNFNAGLDPLLAAKPEKGAAPHERTREKESLWFFERDSHAENAIPPLPRDMGNTTTGDFPVLYQIAELAVPDRVVRKEEEYPFNPFNPFLKGVKELERNEV